MTKTTDQEEVSTDSGVGSSRRRSALASKSTSKWSALAIVLLVAAYSFAAPKLNSRFGWSLPQIKADASGNVRLASTDVSGSDEALDGQRDGKNQGTLESVTKGAGDTKAKRGPLADRMRAKQPEQSGSSRGPPATVDAKDSDAKDSDAKDSDAKQSEDLRFGLLKEISPNRYVSPAGLLYTPGSAEGHRLEHLRRHTKDDPGRPGSHGVFDGDMEGALKTIDRAYERAKKGQRTTKRTDQGRTIYTVDMGGRVGYVGGRDGGRKRKPMARRVRIVLEGNRLITAYPL